LSILPENPNVRRSDTNDNLNPPNAAGLADKQTCGLPQDRRDDSRADAFASRKPCCRRLLRLAPGDNVAVATADLPAGLTIAVDNTCVALIDAIPMGHKVAVANIAAGEEIHKYGCPIGSASGAIRIGQWVHTHNLKSDYLPTFVLESGPSAKEPPT
jgi:altronate dehydratase small subunit